MNFKEEMEKKLAEAWRKYEEKSPEEQAQIRERNKRFQRKVRDQIITSYIISEREKMKNSSDHKPDDQASKSEGQTNRE